MPWFIVQVGTNREDKARRSLLARVEASGLGEVVPRVLVLTQRKLELVGGERRTVERKLYPGYVLIEIVSDEAAIPAEVWHLIRETPGSARFVGSPLSPEEVAKVLRILEASSEIEPSVAVEFERGEHVRVREGAFVGFAGTVEEVQPDKGLVKVVVPVFDRPTSIELEYWKLEKMDR